MVVDDDDGDDVLAVAVLLLLLVTAAVALQVALRAAAQARQSVARRPLLHLSTLPDRPSICC